MSESKAVLNARSEAYKADAEMAWKRVDEVRDYYHEEIAKITAKHSKSVEFHKDRYANLDNAVKNVYGISVDTLLKADEFKQRQAQAAELMDAYTEAINAPEAKPKGKN